MITEIQYKALCLVRDNPGIQARYFARYMWPDSGMHTKSSNQGNGACHGKAAWLCGGSFLGKLRKKGYLKNLSNEITSEGKEAITEYEKAKNT